MVGAGRFERPTARTPSVCATRLRYAPKENAVYQIRRGMSAYSHCPLFPINKSQLLKAVRLKAEGKVVSRGRIECNS